MKTLQPPPKFAQVCMIVKTCLTRHPTMDLTSLEDVIKRSHVKLGFQYEADKIHRALAAVLRDRWKESRSRSVRAPQPIRDPQALKPQEDPPDWRRFSRGQPPLWDRLTVKRTPDD